MATSKEINALTAGKMPAVGHFHAAVKGSNRFLDTVNVFLLRGENSFIIIGSENNVNAIACSVPAQLEDDGPHTVEDYEGGVVWSVDIENKRFEVKTGKVIFCYTDDRTGVKGEINFTLSNDEIVIGEFTIRNQK